MKVIDLTHVIEEKMPVYPGTETPRLEPANTYEKDGFQETRISMFSHIGTHMDPPAHLFPQRTTLDCFPPEQFIGKAIVIDCRDLSEGESITLDYIRRTGKKPNWQISFCSILAGIRVGVLNPILVTIPVWMMK